MPQVCPKKPLKDIVPQLKHFLSRKRLPLRWLARSLPGFRHDLFQGHPKCVAPVQPEGERWPSCEVRPGNLIKRGFALLELNQADELRHYDNTSALLIGLVILWPLMAVEYVTLTKANPTYISNPNDVIQILTARSSSTTFNAVNLEVDGIALSIPFGLSSSTNAATNPNSCEGLTFHGVTSWTVSTSYKFIIVLRITKPNEGFESEPLVVPVSQGPNYSVALETSTDMQIWVPAAPGDYASTGPARFFRVKAAVAPGKP